MDANFFLWNLWRVLGCRQNYPQGFINLAMPTLNLLILVSVYLML